MTDLKISKYAAIDIGSNAIRLFICNVLEKEGKPTQFRKSALTRVPIRLGEDVFKNNEISTANQERMLDAMQAFKLLMQAHNVVAYRACATSAMREASNGYAFAKACKEKTKIDIEIIDGDEEAEIIAATDLASFIDAEKTYLYVDVGGGSTEFTIYHKSAVVQSKSFKIGTVRLLNDLVDRSTWKDVEMWIKENTKMYDTVQLLGSGGNINKIFKLSAKKEGKPLSYFWLLGFYNDLQTYSYEERIIDLGLNTDRADVIIPACKIYLSSMKWSRAKSIYVPKIGLADGIVKRLYLSTHN